MVQINASGTMNARDCLCCGAFVSKLIISSGSSRSTRRRSRTRHIQTHSLTHRNTYRVKTSNMIVFFLLSRAGCCLRTLFTTSTSILSASLLTYLLCPPFFFVLLKAPFFLFGRVRFDPWPLLMMTHDDDALCASGALTGDERKLSATN